jgi:hypothetical protein
MTLPDLIKRLEEARSGSFELDCAIHKAVRRADYERLGLVMPEYGPPYTVSLDAALTLVPEGWDWDVRNYRDWDVQGYRDRAAALVVKRYEAGQPQPNPPGYDGHGAAPALALVIAALKAREAAR